MVPAHDLAARTPPPADRRAPPTWANAAKDGVGTSLDPRSRVWFTIAGGILTEVYFPRVDCANTRDLRLVLTDDQGFFSDEAADTETQIESLEPGVPAYRIRSRCARGRYSMEKVVVADDARSAVLMRVRIASTSDGPPLRVHVLLAPHVGGRGHGNDAWFGDYKGMPSLFARRSGTTLALACSAPFGAVSCGFAGDDDPWHDLKAHGRLTMQRPHAVDGNLLLAAEIETDTSQGAIEFVVVLAFGTDHHGAGAHARAALMRGFDGAMRAYVDAWCAALAPARPLRQGLGSPEANDIQRAYRTSIAALRVHEDKSHPGAVVASLATPWGEAHGDQDKGGYHLVWPRDAVEVAGGLLAAGLAEPARRLLLYLMSTQEAAGHWPQNMWVNGQAYWRGVQLDEAGLPVLLADLLARHGALGQLDPWPTVRRAATFIADHGPATPEDRWEAEGGYSPYTMAVEIAALLAAADFADRAGEPDFARSLRDTADGWNESVERYTYCCGGELAERLGIDGYYVRLGGVPATQVSPDALALVRFGLRRADDPRIRNTICAIDATLETQTRTGRVWHRFTGDTYGESEDGRPTTSDGIGRGWPLLAGERAHYEIAHGRLDVARELCHTMIRQCGRGGLLPEQVWDAADIPDRGLFNGRPTGSAMPLAWAHAELLKLCRSIDEAKVFDMPPQTVARYLHRHR